ncbi:NfeD family protein [Piscinibacter sakaiensis]|uniref:Putative membrane-bound ClpP-class protease n=1 Tax=Piscinibacter sakaiensis TaxID=1547922 RepID=A0A0K8P0K5_PISS1|nr:nodulation protein NfeD [Piscinibacter sakaiensis]GAP36153.1 putative membrane-bound ClpP-class protease [Piscinibacter sakaiensis]
MTRLLALAFVLLACAGVLPAAAAPHAAVVTIEGPIGPALARHVRQAIERAPAAGAAVVVLRIDTPGGLDASMREIVRAILASPLPVLGHVAPGGARAASAGTYLLMACHVAAMAPGTNLGAATPVALTAGGAASGAPGAKAVNDAAAYLSALAELRGRDARWAAEAVRGAASLDATAALQRGVIDLLAGDTAELLRRADGRHIALASGTVTLATAALAPRAVPVDARTRLLAVLGHPNVALLLLTIGVYGLLFEFLAPGSGVPGVVGALSLLLGLYALSVLPLDLAGVALLLLGLALLVAEGFAPSFGVLGLGGALAFMLGAALLVDDPSPVLAVSLPLAAGVALAALATSLLALRLALRSRRGRPATGAEGLPGTPARVLSWAAGRGHVQLHGERWQATGPPALAAGDAVVVRAVRGLRVDVEPVGSAAPLPAPPEPTP